MLSTLFLLTWVQYLIYIADAQSTLWYTGMDTSGGVSSSWTQTAGITPDDWWWTDQNANPCPQTFFCWRLNDNGAISRSVSTVGYHHVSLTYSFSADGFAGQDECVIEYSADSGTSWTDILRVTSNTAPIVDHSYAFSSIADNIAQLAIRLRAISKGHVCLFSHFTLSAAAITTAPTSAPTETPTTHSPTTRAPSLAPYESPTAATTAQPTVSTTSPTAAPTQTPTAPTSSPTATPTTPTSSPTYAAGWTEYFGTLTSSAYGGSSSTLAGGAGSYVTQVCVDFNYGWSSNHGESAKIEKMQVTFSDGSVQQQGGNLADSYSACTTAPLGTCFVALAVRVHSSLIDPYALQLAASVHDLSAPEWFPEMVYSNCKYCYDAQEFATFEGDRSRCLTRIEYVRDNYYSRCEQLRFYFDYVDELLSSPSPTMPPTLQPSLDPTGSPTSAPTVSTSNPTVSPTSTTSAPTSPTQLPTLDPTLFPTRSPLTGRSDGKLRFHFDDISGYSSINGVEQAAWSVGYDQRQVQCAGSSCTTDSSILYGLSYDDRPYSDCRDFFGDSCLQLAGGPSWIYRSEPTQMFAALEFVVDVVGVDEDPWGDYSFNCRLDFASSANPSVWHTNVLVAVSSGSTVKQYDATVTVPDTEEFNNASYIKYRLYNDLQTSEWEYTFCYFANLEIWGRTLYPTQEPTPTTTPTNAPSTRQPTTSQPTRDVNAKATRKPSVLIPSNSAAVPTPASSNPNNQDQVQASSGLLNDAASSMGLSNGALVGVVGAAGVLVLLLCGVVVFIVLRKRRPHDKVAADDTEMAINNAADRDVINTQQSIAEDDDDDDVVQGLGATKQ